MADRPSNPVTENRSGLIGKPVDRVDGKLKVTGGATYAYEVKAAADAVYGVAVGATIPAGRIVGVDTARAEASPGVLLVWTHRNAPAQGALGAKQSPDSQSGAMPQLASDRVRYYGQAVALVVADSFENAVAGAALVRLDYAKDEAAAVDFPALSDQGETPEGEEDSRVGDFEAAFAAAAVTVDQTWTTPVQNHCQMEPHATTAWWDGDMLHVQTSNQMVKRPQHGLAETLMIPRKNVHLMAPFIGGGFGGKFHFYADAVLAALAARELRRPVKLAFTRQQMFHMTTHRPATIQRVRLGADRSGRLTAIAHEAITHSNRDETFVEHAAALTRNLYAAPNRLVGHRLVKMDLPIAGAMRAPGEAVGMLALECAMDELAEALGVDPVDLRLRNEPDRDPTDGRPFSTRHLVQCLNEGAQKFGWSRRKARPGQVRDGRWNVGIGMAAAIRGNFLLAAKANIRIEPDGTVVVRQAMTDIGTGTYTILAQIAAETMGVTIAQVRVELGDSDWAPTPGSGGSFGAASAGSAALDAGVNLRLKLAALAVGDPASPLYGGDVAKVNFAGGALAIANRSETLAALVARAAPEGVEAAGQVVPGTAMRDYSQHTYGGHFCEVGVDVVTGEVRLRRMLGVFDAGRILNAKTARSQLTGGMIWGVGGALCEENEVDARFGSFVAQDLAGYHVPAHADIVDLDAYFLPTADEHANPMGIKGVGELGICGAGAAVANAVYNACGVRVRDYPITLEKVLAGLAD